MYPGDPGFTTLWIYTILKLRSLLQRRRKSFTTLWIYTILKRQSIRLSISNGFTTLWIYTILKHRLARLKKGRVSLPYGFTLFSNNHSNIDKIVFVSLPYGFTLFSNVTSDTAKELQFHYLMDLHYSQTSFLFVRPFFLFHYLMDLHYSQTRFYKKTKNAGFTTLWIYTILKPQISCAHYTAQGKSTRSSTIVLWRNEIVKGAQIPIQHIEFGAHIYAHRRLAL